MQELRSFASLLYLLLFTVAVVPFNLLHTHEADEHRIALITHQQDHACALDESFCKAEVPGACGHEHHIGLPSEKCFSCQFHFEKHYTCAHLFPCNALPVRAIEYATGSASETSQTLLHLSNKSPPHNC